MARTLRKTFRPGRGDPLRRLVGIAVNGAPWREVFEACVGFLGDEDVPPGHFAAGDLELLAAMTQERLHQVSSDAGLPCRCAACRPAGQAGA